MIQTTIQGAKGGGGQRTPVQAPDSLRSISYFRILDLVSEGEIGGLVNGLQSVYLNDTPLANADGSLNFQNAHVETRTGTQDQDYIPGYAAVENEVAVGVELKSAAPWMATITNTQLSAVRITLGVPQLQSTNTSNGDINGYTVGYHIDVQTDGGAWQTALTSSFSGKTTSKYQRSHRIDLPPATQGWNVRVVRTTANANSATVADVTTVDSYTQIIDAKLRYPNSAMVAVNGDAQAFQNIPTRSYDMWGRVIRVPSNYDPLARTYTGVWDGSFKVAWSNNPAWVFLDLISHPRYGLGDRISAAQVDKWALYAIARYCDESVSDGNSGTEPRFTCNVFLQTASDAYKLLGDLASLFRGLAYWNGVTITATADMPADPAYLYTGANVIGGKFTYASSPRTARYTTALVTWNNPANAYAAEVEYVQHDAGLRRYGIQPMDMVAFGCTSRGQAQRAGQWALQTSQQETETVTFDVGKDGMLAAPGQIIRVQDPARAGKRQGGRIHAASTTTITVDHAPDAVAVGDKLTCTLPSGTTETHDIAAVNGATLTVAAPGFSAAPLVDASWLAESAALVAQQFRVISVAEVKSEDQVSYTITAVQNAPGKYGNIDTSAIAPQLPISALPMAVQAPPTNVAVTSAQVVVQGASQPVVTITWTPAAGAESYRVEWQRNSGGWISAGTANGQSIDVYGAYTGSYVARVVAVSSSGVLSLPAVSDATPVAGKVVPPDPPTLTATGGQLQIVLNWTWPAGVNVEDTSYTEVWVSPTSTMADGTSVGATAYPGTSYTISGLLPQEQRYAWVRLVDKSGNVGPWSLPASAVGGTAADLFKPLQDQSDQLRTDVDATLAQVQQEVTDRTTAINNEANARATAILNEQNARKAAVTNETNLRQSGDQSLATQIRLVSAGSGEQFDSAKIWYFDTDLEQWSGNGAPTIVDGWLRPANSANDPFVYSPAGLGIDGSSYRFVKLRIKKVGNPAWDGSLFWTTPSAPAFNAARRVGIAQSPYDANGVTTISWQDIPWWPNTIDAIRVDLSNTQTDTDYFLIDWIAIGRPTPGAGVALVQTETAARQAADSAEATQRTTLATQMRGAYTGTDVAGVTSGLVYSEAQARSTADGALATRASTLEARMPSGTGQLATAASVTDETTARTSADSALSTRIDSVTATANGNTAAINSEATTRATADTAMAQDVSLLGAHNAGKTAFVLNQGTVQVDGAGTTLGQYMTSVQAANTAVNARVDSEHAAWVNGDAANASAITAVSSRTEQPRPNLMKNPTGRIDTSGWSVFGVGTMPTLYTNLTDPRGPFLYSSAFSGGAGDYVNVSSEVVPMTLSGQPVSMALDTTSDVPVQFVAVCKIAGAPDQYPAQITIPQGDLSRHSLSFTTPANVTGVAFVIQAAQSYNTLALRSAKIEVASAPTPFNEDTANTATASATQQLSTTVTNQDGRITANANAITAVQVRMPDGTGTVATASSVTAVQNQVNASYTVALDVNGRVSGVVQQNNGQTSSFDVLADRFSVVDPTGGPNLLSYSAGNLTVTGTVTGSLLKSSAMELGSTRIHTGSGRLAPFVVRDVACVNAGGINNANRTLTLDGFVSPAYGSGYHYKRFAAQVMDVFIDVVANCDNPSNTSANETVIIQRSVDGGAWANIVSVTGRAAYAAPIPITVRYTTPSTWSTIAFQATTTQGNTVALSLSVMVLNFNQSGNAPDSNSGVSGATGAPPPADTEPPFCVDWETTVLPDGRYVRDLVVGDLVEVVDVRSGERSLVPLRAMCVGYEECYLVTTEHSAVIQSASTPMDMRDGSVLRTPELGGHELLTHAHGWETAAIEFVGRRKVCKPDFGDRMFFAGVAEDRTLATHNMKYKP